jgi:predicted RNA-binding Zn-ribbon protein involved in translation (DUF1610 family)
MPISFQCQNCGKKLKAPDSAVGKSSKCPQCGAKVTCPEPVYDAEIEEGPSPLPGSAKPAGVAPHADLDDGSPYALRDPDPEPAPAPAETGRHPCPMCGEMILQNAAKCRFCGEVFDPALKKSQKTKYGAEESNLSVGDIAVAILCSGIGCIAGLVWMIQGKPKGLKMFGLSFLVAVILNVINVFVQMSLHGPGRPGGP